jgi:DNA-binding NarL/FixJ family response regulator
MTVRVLVVDDHPTFVRAVTLLLNGDPDIEVVATASDGAQAIDLAMQHQPDVVLMDINMPAMNGLDATREIIDAAPHIAVVALTMFDDDDNVAAAMQRGAAGYLLKGARQDQIRRAVHAAHAGEAIFDAPIARRLKNVFADRPRSSGRDVFAQLTDREFDVLDHLAAGLDNQSIAAQLYLSEKTVRNYVSSLFAKLHVDTRAEAVVLARDAGLGRQ